MFLGKTMGNSDLSIIHKRISMSVGLYRYVQPTDATVYRSCEDEFPIIIATKTEQAINVKLAINVSSGVVHLI